MSPTTQNLPSWGRLRNQPRKAVDFAESEAFGDDQSCLPFGNGRSYGDSCHNDLGLLLLLKECNKILSFDQGTGTLKAQAGVLLSDILNLTATTGWFPPVVPGTRFITLGGAIANDIHGKNHEHAGTFGCHVSSLKLLRSNGSVLTCSPQENTELFSATIGGYGLTGVILEAEIRMKKVSSHFVLEKKTAFGSVREFMALAQLPESDCEYSVAWVDSLATGKNLGRGIFMTGEHVVHQQVPNYKNPWIQVPFTPPLPLVSGLPLIAFNKLYGWANTRKQARHLASPQSYFFPLDAVGGWNRLYGPKGLFQHQCVLPTNCAEEVIVEMLEMAQTAGQGSFLTVLKRFGTIRSPGLMSFPRPGYTLTLDFANKGKKTLDLLESLDQLTVQSGGRTNPYKDARMSAATFQSGFPEWQQLEALRDPAFNSDFWRRVTGRTVVPAPQIQAPPKLAQINHTAKPEIQEADL